MNNIERILSQANNNLDKQYKSRVVELIHEKYDYSDEMALIRQQNEKPEEYTTYYAYCEECKKQAKLEVYGEE